MVTIRFFFAFVLHYFLIWLKKSFKPLLPLSNGLSGLTLNEVQISMTEILRENKQTGCSSHFPSVCSNKRVDKCVLLVCFTSRDENDLPQLTSLFTCIVQIALILAVGLLTLLVADKWLSLLR